MKAARLDFFLCASSGIVLALAYPRVSFFLGAWFALVPLLWSLRRAETAKDAVRRAAIAGACFFFFSLSWLRFVTVFGWLFVAAFETLFFCLLGALLYQALRLRHLPLRAAAAAAAWMLVEILRSELPVFGLGWNLLAYSQTPWLQGIQAASFLGAYGLGFLMFTVNVLLFEALGIFFSSKGLGSGCFKTRAVRGAAALIAALMIPGLLALYGNDALRRADPSSADSLRVSVIQGNIPQSVKWEVMAREQILQIYSKLTELASYDVPDLILWPEASFPGFFNVDGEAKRVIEDVQRFHTPLVVGAPFFESRKKVYNSAYLVDAQGVIRTVHHKLKLVPFGEYVPLGALLAWLEPIAETLGVSDFSAGRSRTVFELQDPKIPFSVLICFEDAFPRLALSFAQQGPRFFAVMTNDAWFGASGAPYQHLQASVFRALETGLPIVRAANTGVSAVISRRGEILGKVEREGRDIFVTGYKTVSVPLENGPTFYLRGGWILPYAAAFAAAFFFSGLYLRSRPKTD